MTGAPGVARQGRARDASRKIMIYNGLRFERSGSPCACGGAHQARGAGEHSIRPGDARALELSWLRAGCLHTRNGFGDSMWQFNSAHPSGVNFARADGSVVTVSRTVDYWT